MLSALLRRSFVLFSSVLSGRLLPILTPPLQVQGRKKATPSGVLQGGRGRQDAAVPEGHVPVYVGEEMERFVVSAEMLHHPLFIGLLNKSAQEYGYEQKGALRIPCHVVVFERVLESLRLGHDSQDLLSALSLDDSGF